MEEHVLLIKPQLLDIFSAVGREIAEDDQDRLFADLIEQLTYFVLVVTATPPRTLRMLIPTLRAIALDPRHFLEFQDKYDPLATAPVLDNCARSSKANRIEVQNYEIGAGAGPDPHEISAAARRVELDFKEAIKSGSPRGRSKLVNQTDLARSLGRIFVAYGGQITRNVVMKTSKEQGAFHQFLELVLPCVQPIARREGFALTVNTMVRKAQMALGEVQT